MYCQHKPSTSANLYFIQATPSQYVAQTHRLLSVKGGHKVPGEGANRDNRTVSVERDCWQLTDMRFSCIFPRSNDQSVSSHYGTNVCINVYDMYDHLCCAKQQTQSTRA